MERARAAVAFMAQRPAKGRLTAGGAVFEEYVACAVCQKNMALIADELREQIYNIGRFQQDAEGNGPRSACGHVIAEGNGRSNFIARHAGCVAVARQTVTGKDQMRRACAPAVLRQIVRQIEVIDNRHLVGRREYAFGGEQTVAAVEVDEYFLDGVMRGSDTIHEIPSVSGNQVIAAVRERRHLTELGDVGVFRDSGRHIANHGQLAGDFLNGKAGGAAHILHLARNDRYARING